MIKIALYDAPTGGTELFAETQPTNTLKGLFNLIIGATGAIPNSIDFGNQYWLGVSVDGGAEMTPRTALTAVPYALHAQTADRASSVSADAQGVVTSINEVDGPIRIIGDSTTSVVQNGRVITISANPQGIRTIQNLDGTIDIIQPRGPTVTIGVADTSISTRKLARNAVTTEKITDQAVTGEKINQMGALTGQVLKWNGTKWLPAGDDTTAIKPGTGIVITTDAQGNNVISTTLVGLPAGTQGATLRHDGTQWVSNTFLYNDGTRIGIGTTSPQARLDVAGNVFLSNSSELRIGDPQGLHYSAFKAVNQANDLTYSLPPRLAVTDALLTSDPNGVMSWVNVIPTAVTIPWNQVTSGINQNQDMKVGDGSSLRLTGTGTIESNSLRGATVGGNSYAGRIAIPQGATTFTVSLPPTVGCSANSSVTISQFDAQGFENIVGYMVTNVATNQFTVQFSASYPTNTGFLTYLVVNP
ncbi:MAG: hypothetical protein JSS75_12420 [Bacteroidetes bacterium]|nr:hypothetical protein [Bacteroidota bacterium]